MEIRSGRRPTYNRPITYRQNGDDGRLITQSQHDVLNGGVLALAAVAWAFAAAGGGLSEFSEEPLSLAVLAVAAVFALDNMYGQVSLDGLFDG